MADKIILADSVLKWKSLFKWSPRQLVLTNETLSCNLPQSRGHVIEACYHVNNIDVQAASSWCFNILQNNVIVLYLKATSAEEKTQWIKAIKDVKESIVHTGALKKWTNMLKGWQPRYFILFNDRLCYYLSQNTTTQRRGTIFIANRNIRLSNSNAKNGFDIAGSSTTWHLKAPTLADQSLWMTTVRSISEPCCSDLPPHMTLSSLETDWKASTSALLDTDTAQLPSAPPRSPSVPDEDSDMENNYRKDLECTICLEILREPTTLSCGHSFCRDCLAELWASVGSTSFTCPSCRQTIASVPSINIAMQNLIPGLYDEELSREPPTRSPHREAFDNQYSGNNTTSNSTNQAGTTRGGPRPTVSPTNMEFEFLKRGMWLIFVIWLIGRFLSPLLYKDSASSTASTATTTEKEEVVDSNGSDSTLFQTLDSRNTVIFLVIGLLECPRFLGLYVLLFWYSSVFYPVIDVVAKLSNQVSSVSLHIKVVIWGSLVPYVWLIPLFYNENQYILAALSALLSGIEIWRLLLDFKQLVVLPNRNLYIFNLLKQSCVISLVRLLFARLVSFLPWSWLPDVVYNCVILCLAAAFISRSIFTVKGLIERSRVVNIPGVQISSVLFNPARMGH